MREFKQKLINTLRMNYCHLKITRFLHPHYHPNRKYYKKYIHKTSTPGESAYMINDNENEAEDEKQIS